VLKLRAKSMRWGCVWTKTVLWTTTVSHSYMRNIDFPLEGENSWANYKYEKCNSFKVSDNFPVFQKAAF
jgi:hypothetical protein